MFVEPDPTVEPQSSNSLYTVDSWSFTPARLRFIYAALLVLASPLVIDWSIAGLSRGHGSEPVTVFFLMSIFVAKYCLLSMWFAWGGSRVVWRLIIVVSSMLISAMVTSRGEVEREFVASSLLMVSAMAVMMAAPRLWGVQWVVLGDEIASQRRNRRRQFSITDIFLWTLAAAILAAAVRWTGMLDQADRGGMWLFLVIFAGIGSLVPAICMLSAMWAVLPPNANLPFRILIAFAVALGLSLFFLIPMSFGRARLDEIFYLLLFFSLSMFWCIIALAFLRAQGHRLIRIPRYAQAEPITRSSPIQCSNAQ